VRAMQKNISVHYQTQETREDGEMQEEEVVLRLKITSSD